MSLQALEVVGTLYGPHQLELRLAPGRPLSHLWAFEQGELIPAARAFAEARGEALRRRMPILMDGRTPADIMASLERTAASRVFIVIAEDVAYLDAEQVQVIGPEIAAANGQSRQVGDLVLETLYRAVASGGQPPTEINRYWGSEWRYLDGRNDDESWWRVWPQGEKQLFKGEFVAKLSSQQLQQLGQPDYVVIESPLDPAMRVYASVEPDRGTSLLNSTEYKDRRIVALSASCRDSIGVLDGEFCRLVAWQRGKPWQRAKPGWRLVKGRAIVAHTKVAARTEVEKQVCRLPSDALIAIGARAEDVVVLETVTYDKKAKEYRRKRVRLRALPIDEAEAAERKTWERSQGTDGWVDPAAVHGIYPPYPALYLDRFAREDLGVPLAGPVTIRTSVASRLASDASEFLWLAVGGIVVVVLTAFHIRPIIAILVPVVATIVFLFWRVQRAVT
ncbi:MAG: hypothetical protein ACJ757_11160 [Gaiellaceae bacterium]